MREDATELRAGRAFMATAVALALALLLQIEWLESAKQLFVWFSGISVALGFVAWLYAAPCLRDTSEAAEPEPAPPEMRVARLPSALLILSVVALAASLLLLFVDLKSRVGGWLWLAAVAGVLLSVAWLERRPRAKTAPDPARWRRAAIALGVVLFALLLRTYQLEHIPADLVDDESLIAEWGLAALHGAPIWEGATAERTTVFRKGGAAEPLPGCVVHAAVMQIAGENTFGLRFTASLAGAIGVGLLYLILRHFLGTGASLAGALLLAVCHTHLYWTRSGMTQALVTAAGAAVILFTLRGLRARGYLDWLLAGTFLGLAQHFYEGGRFLVPILVPFFLVLFVGQRGFARRHFVHVAAMALIATAVFAPLGFWYLGNPDSLLAITHGAYILEQPDYLADRFPGMSTAQIILAQLRQSLEGFTVHGDLGTFYPIWVPLLDPVVRALILVGILGFTLTPRAPYFLVSLWLWVPVAIACTVTTNPPPMSRLMLALPSVFAVAAAVLDRLGRLATRGFGATGATLATFLGALLLAGAALWNIDIFFVEYPAHFPGNTLTAASRLAAETGDAYKAYFVGPDLSSGAPTARFLAHAVVREDVQPDELPVQDRGRRGGLFLMPPEAAEVVDRLRELYPGGQLSEHRRPDGELLLLAYRVELEELQRALGAEAAWRDPEMRFGWAGSRTDEFGEARALAVGADGTIYVADAGNRRVAVFDRDGRFVRNIGAASSGKGSVGEVSAIAVERDGNLLTIDRAKRSLKRLRGDGEPVGRLGNARMFDDPVSVAVAPDDTIVVLDAARSAVVRLSPRGEEIARAGELGSGPGQFANALAVAVGGDGRVYVADYGNGRVQRLAPDLTYETEWPIPHAEVRPEQILAADGAIYVADPEGHRVQRFTRDGEQEFDVGAPGTSSTRLGWPVAVAVDHKGAVYVLDNERASVYRFDVPLKQD